MSQELIATRFKALRFNLGKSQSEMAGEMGVDQRKISRIETGVQSIDGKFMIKLGELYQVNSQWILQGLGDQFVKSVQDYAVAARTDMEIIPVASTNCFCPSNCRWKKSMPKDTTDELPVSLKWFESAFPGIDVRSVKAYYATSDSMSPTINPGDLCIINPNGQFYGDGIYMICVKGTVFVKRTQWNVDGSVTLQSDNPSYHTQTIDSEVINNGNYVLVGRILWTGHRL